MPNRHVKMEPHLHLILRHCELLAKVSIRTDDIKSLRQVFGIRPADLDSAPTNMNNDYRVAGGILSINLKIPGTEMKNIGNHHSPRNVCWSDNCVVQSLGGVELYSDGTINKLPNLEHGVRSISYHTHHQRKFMCIVLESGVVLHTVTEGVLLADGSELSRLEIPDALYSVRDEYIIATATKCGSLVVHGLWEISEFSMQCRAQEYGRVHELGFLETEGGEVPLIMIFEGTDTDDFATYMFDCGDGFHRLSYSIVSVSTLHRVEYPKSRMKASVN